MTDRLAWNADEDPYYYKFVEFERMKGVELGHLNDKELPLYFLATQSRFNEHLSKLSDEEFDLYLKLQQDMLANIRTTVAQLSDGLETYKKLIARKDNDMETLAVMALYRTAPGELIVDQYTKQIASLIIYLSANYDISATKFASFTHIYGIERLAKLLYRGSHERMNELAEAIVESNIFPIEQCSTVFDGISQFITANRITVSDTHPVEEAESYDQSKIINSLDKLKQTIEGTPFIVERRKKYFEDEGYAETSIERVAKGYFVGEFARTLTWIESEGNCSLLEEIYRAIEEETQLPISQADLLTKSQGVLYWYRMKTKTRPQTLPLNIKNRLDAPHNAIEAVLASQITKAHHQIRGSGVVSQENPQAANTAKVVMSLINLTDLIDTITDSTEEILKLDPLKRTALTQTFFRIYKTIYMGEEVTINESEWADLPSVISALKFFKGNCTAARANLIELLNASGVTDSDQLLIGYVMAFLSEEAKSYERGSLLISQGNPNLPTSSSYLRDVARNISDISIVGAIDAFVTYPELSLLQNYRRADQLLDALRHFHSLIVAEDDLLDTWQDRDVDQSNIWFYPDQGEELIENLLDEQRKGIALLENLNTEVNITGFLEHWLHASCARLEMYMSNYTIEQQDPQIAPIAARYFEAQQANIAELIRKYSKSRNELSYELPVNVGVASGFQSQAQFVA